MRRKQYTGHPRRLTGNNISREQAQRKSDDFEKAALATDDRTEAERHRQTAEHWRRVANGQE